MPGGRPLCSNSVQPVPAWVDEPVSPVRKSYSGATNNRPIPKIHGKVGCQNWLAPATAYFAAGGEHDQYDNLLYSKSKVYFSSDAFSNQKRYIAGIR